MTFYEAAIEVLRDEGRPLHFKKITAHAITRNLLSHVGRTPEDTMEERLTQESKKAETDSLIRAVRPGVFTLVEGADIEEARQTVSPRESTAETDRQHTDSTVIAKKIVDQQNNETTADSSSSESHRNDGRQQRNQESKQRDQKPTRNASRSEQSSRDHRESNNDDRSQNTRGSNDRQSNNDNRSQNTRGSNDRQSNNDNRSQNNRDSNDRQSNNDNRSQNNRGSNDRQSNNDNRSQNNRDSNDRQSNDQQSNNDNRSQNNRNSNDRQSNNDNRSQSSKNDVVADTGSRMGDIAEHVVVADTGSRMGDIAEHVAGLMSNNGAMSLEDIVRSMKNTAWASIEEFGPVAIRNILIHANETSGNSGQPPRFFELNDHRWTLAQASDKELGESYDALNEWQTRHRQLLLDRLSQQLLGMSPGKLAFTVGLIMERLGYEQITDGKKVSDEIVNLVGNMDQGFATERIVIRLLSRGNEASEQAVISFRGSLNLYKADRGILISLDGFHDSADQHGRVDNVAPISLVAVKEIARLMLKTNVGVCLYEVSTACMDDAFFAS